MNRLNEIIKGRTVAIMSHGRSIEALEDHIVDLNEKDICWVSLGLYTIMEQYILSKVNKTLDIVFDCATVPEPRIDHYERIRLPRIHQFLNRPSNNLWITTHGLIRDSIKPLMPELLIDWYRDKIFQVDWLFPKDEIGHWMDVPNSMTLLIGAMIAGGANQIIIFGLDGYTGDVSKGVDSYYKREHHIKERQAALGTWEDPGINRDSVGFEGRFPQRLEEYRELFKNECPIYNCSPNSMYTVIPKITYEQLKDLV